MPGAGDINDSVAITTELARGAFSDEMLLHMRSLVGTRSSASRKVSVTTTRSGRTRSTRHAPRTQP
jgi:hypothetical protein